MTEPTVILIGAGHAGCEAALACARRGLSTWIYTLNADTIGFMPCNPSIGGLGKGHLVKEIAALGGEMGRAADKACIQYKLLGSSKGPAVQGSRMQCDRMLYSMAMKSALEKESNILIRESMIDGLLLHKGACMGVIERSGHEVRASAVIIASGTFLDGMIHIGATAYGAGRSGEFPSVNLAVQLRQLGFPCGRFKTGTPPRLKGETVNYSVLIEDPGDKKIRPFALESRVYANLHKACFRTYTSEATHRLVRENLTKSSLYSGAIKGSPARYCPSLEDKIARFPERERHPVVVEPEGIHTSEVYLKGLGNSLPPELQIRLVRSIPGLESAEITRQAYAIEYEYINPICLRPTLETKLVSNLYFAGQINGTSGYEEAAGQGLWAGINATNKILGLPEFILDRSEAYMAVMIDDLVLRGVDEPYRMFTSRSEYRLLLREDNATDRLAHRGRELGLLDEDTYREIDDRAVSVRKVLVGLNSMRVKPVKTVNDLVTTKGGSTLHETVSGLKFLKRPEITIEDLRSLGMIPQDMDPEDAKKIEVEVKYEGYIDRQNKEAAQQKKLETISLPANMNYDSIPGLSSELREKLRSVRPISIGNVSRISGITPAAITAIMVAVKK